MGRKKNSSPKSHRLIRNALLSGPKYFEELWKITGLHRNTLNDRLKHLVSVGLIKKRKSGQRTYYEIIEPLHNVRRVLTGEGQEWSKYLCKIDPEEKRKRRAILRNLIKKEKSYQKLRSVLFKAMTKYERQFDELIERPESQELLEIIPNWKSISEHKLQLILDLNQALDYLNSHRLICPYCYHYGTLEDHELNEIVCEECKCVVGDEIIQPRERLRLIMEFLEESNVFKN